jgi:hypothetical protein
MNVARIKERGFKTPTTIQYYDSVRNLFCRCFADRFNKGRHLHFDLALISRLDPR